MMELDGKKVKIIFLDGENHYSSKTGTVVSVDSDFIYLDTGIVEVIPKSRVVRMEVLG